MELRVTSNPLRAGQASVAIFRHSLVGHGGVPVISVAEKQLKNSSSVDSEIKIYRQIMASAEVGQQCRVLPDVYSIQTRQEYHSIFMRYYSGVGERLEDTDFHARIIAKAIHELNEQRIIDSSRNQTDKKEAMSPSGERLKSARACSNSLAERLCVPNRMERAGRRR